MVTSREAWQHPLNQTIVSSMVSERNTLCSNSNWVLWAVLPYLELGTWTGQTSEMFISLISACYQPLAPLINPGKLSKSTDLTFQSFPFSSCSQRALVRVSTVLPAHVGPVKKKKKKWWPPKVDSHRVKSRTWRGGGCLLPCPGSVQELQPTEEFSHSKCDMPAFSTISYNHIGDQQEKTHFD